MSEKIVINNGILRRFGLIMACIFAVVIGGIIPFLFSHHFPRWPFIVAIVFLLPSVIFPLALKPVYIIWMKIGDILGWVNSRIVLGIIFFGIFTPVSLILKLFRKDLMRKRKSISKSTYRILSKNHETNEMEVPY